MEMSEGARIAQRIKNAPKGFSEAQILKFQLDRLEGYRLAHRLEYIRLNSGNIKSEYTTKGRMMGGVRVGGGVFKQRYIKLAKKGTADIVIFLSGGRAFFVETKDEAGQQTPEQKQFQKFVELLGFHYYLARSVQDMEIALGKEGFNNGI